MHRTIKPDDVLNALAGDVSLLRSLSEIYWEDYRAMLQEMNGATEASHAVIVREAAHRLRGLVGHFRSVELVGLLCIVERNAVSNELPSQAQLDEIAELCDLLADELREIVNSLEA